MRRSTRAWIIIMIVSATVFPTAPSLQAQDPVPTMGPIVATKEGNVTTYTTQVSYPACSATDCPFDFTWSKTGQHCGTFQRVSAQGPSGPGRVSAMDGQNDTSAVWDYTAPSCPPPPHPSATIVARATDGLWTCTASYPNGSVPGTGQPGTCQQAAPRCILMNGVLTVSPAGRPTIIRVQNGQIQVIFDPATSPDPSCNGATVDNTESIDVEGSVAGDVITVDASQGKFANSTGVPIGVNILAGGGNDTLDLSSGPGDDVFKVDPGSIPSNPIFMFNQSPLNLADLENVNLDPSGGTNTLTFTGGDGNDSFTLDGTPSAFNFDFNPNTTFAFDPTTFQPLQINGGSGANTFNVGGGIFSGTPTVEVPTDGPPLLLSPTDQLDEKVLAEIERLNPTILDILGGDVAVRGGDGEDVVNVFSGGSAGTAAFAFPPGPFTPDGLLITFNGLQSGNLNTGEGADTIKIDPDLFGTDLQLDAFGGGGLDRVVFQGGPPAGPMFLGAGSTLPRAQAIPPTGSLNTSNDGTPVFFGFDIEKWTLFGGAKKNVITAAGGAGTGGPFAYPVTIDGKAGADKLTGGSAKDKLIGGTGKDICSGGKNDVFKSCETVKRNNQR